MKNILKIRELRKKNVEELNTELLKLMHEKFDLRMQTASGKIKKNHLLKQIRRDIARIKTILTEEQMRNDQ